MTNKEKLIEMKNNLKNAIEALEKADRLLGDDLEGWYERYFDNMMWLNEYTTKAEKYRWHDLRKNPEDLPKSDGIRCICARWDYVTDSVFYGMLWCVCGKWCHLDHQRESTYDYAVIAWREIEPFEEVEE